MKRPKPAGDRKKAALKRLGVSQDDLKTSPDISSLLKMGKGGLMAALAAMRFSKDLNIVSFIEKYDSISERDRKSLSWEAIAISADVDAAYLLGATILAIQAHSSNAVKILALTNHPEITRARINFGTSLPGAERDRTAVDTGLGFLPQSKGSTFIINPTLNKHEAKDDIEDPEDERESDLDHLFPSLSTTQEKLVPVRARLIEAGS